MPIGPQYYGICRQHFYGICDHVDVSYTFSMRYRYKTVALVGTWFSSAHMAVADAIRAGQAFRAEDGTITWRVPASIEAIRDEDVTQRAA